MSKLGDQSGLTALHTGSPEFEAVRERLQPLVRDTSVEFNPSEAILQVAGQQIKEVITEGLKELPVHDQIKHYNKTPIQTVDIKVMNPSLDTKVNIAASLSADQHKQICDFVRAHFHMSHEHISRRYGYWKEAEEVHDLYVSAEALDNYRKKKDAGQRGRVSITDLIRTPYARAIADTNATYMLAIFGGTKPFGFEPAGMRSKRTSAKIIERVISEQMRRIGLERNIYQMALDRNRYGVAPIVVSYGKGGNQVTNWDPWNWFPDPRVTAQNRDEAGFEGYRSWASLVTLYRRGIYQNLEKLKKSSMKFGWACNRDIRENIRGQSVDPLQPGQFDQGNKESFFSLGNSHVLNTLWIFMHPNWFGLEGSFGLYRITVADEETVILFDKSPYPHGKLPRVIVDGDMDFHKTFNSGMYDLMMPMQRFQDWLLRARVENVQSVITNRVVVDPLRINMMDLMDPNPAKFIRTMPGADPNGAINPITVQDATKGFWQDLDMAGQLMQRLTAASDTAQGVQTATERSATEIARLTALGQQRQGMQARLISATSWRPLAQLLLENEQYFGIQGGSIQLPREMQGRVMGMDKEGWYQWRHSDILGEYDYQVVDGTLPMDPRENSQSLIRAIKTLTDTGTAADWNMNKFIESFLQSEGFEDLDNWRLNADEKAKQMADIAKMQQANQPQLGASQGGNMIPNEDVRAGLESGNLISVAEAAKQFGADNGQPSVVA